MPNKIIIDSGFEFNNERIKNLLEGFQIKLHIILVSTPQSNGLIERFHSSLIEHLRLIEQREHFKNLDLIGKISIAMIAYNNSLNNTK